MDKVLERYIRKHADETALYLQAERRDGAHQLIAPARAALFFTDLEKAQDFQVRYGLNEPLIEVQLAPGQQAYGALISPHLAREIREVPGVRHTEDKGRPSKKEEAAEEGPRRMTSRDMEDLTRLVMRSWQEVPGLKKEPSAEEPKKERPSLVSGFRRDKLTDFLGHALLKSQEHEREGHEHAAEDGGFRLPKNGGPKNGGPPRR